ncbi:hypothetical protein DCS_03083 [Drechmeria coniospora]|uniref:Uncharacterized protein n=1 Tax=Drechmeria coniospora TaxID=98403 RepID=A0A151GXV5_DRECN|nr:hypothetical protein DCS_03083 [Drechmeria coniospora]KYK61938.1 hypothetical protein DCS_03083 [Drechmeria coniospora]ODA79665.1 hypothetical protein RJ55_05259 [Drechmeria coniospora]
MPGLFDSRPRGLMAGNNIFFATFVVLASWNDTHTFNPHWTRHAKFHSGQTLSFGVLSALTSTYLLHRRNPTAAAGKDSLFMAAVVGSLTAVSGLSAIFYPDSAWMDPEWDNGWPIGPNGVLFLANLVATWMGYSYEKARLDKLDKKD